MRRIGYLRLAVSSLVLTLCAQAATRPHYGGALRVQLREAPSSLDPAQADTPALGNLSRLIFDTLVRLDDRGATEPGLAASWTADPGGQRWHFTLRSGVAFQDGSALTADAAAASLRAANPQWKVFSDGNSVTVELDAPADSPAVLALPRNGIAKRSGGKLVGTGAFAISDWQAGKQLTLVANNDYWDGRPFLDSIEMEFGKNYREQTIALDLGKAEVIEIPPEETRHAMAENRQVESSAPSELMALEFSRTPQSDDEGHLRQALGLSIDRTLLNNVMLQGGGEPAGSVLPEWMTGYAFLFSPGVNLQEARKITAAIRQPAPWTLAYDGSDAIARVVAERIVLNARDTGLTLTLTTSSTSDLRLVRVPLASMDSREALVDVAAKLGLPQPKIAGGGPEALYTAESMLLQSQRVIPLLHLRVSYGLGKSVHGWSMSPEGDWRIPDVWLGGGQP